MLCVWAFGVSEVANEDEPMRYVCGKNVYLVQVYMYNSIPKRKYIL